MTLQKNWQAVSAEPVPDVSIERYLSATQQEGLPQTPLMKGMLERLVEEGVLEEAYLRGSFSLGTADALSDIDLFVVVDPENLSKAYDVAINHLNENNPPIVSCHDRLVKDYGGIGFMLICENGPDDMVQLDLYFALKGVAAKQGLFECPRIYSRDKQYLWGSDKGNVTLPQSAQDFIAAHTKGDHPADKLELLAKEMIVTMSIMGKHIKRDQIFRASNDDRHAIDLNIEMLEIVSGQPKTVHSPIYLADEMVANLCSGGSDELSAISRKLKALLVEPISDYKIMSHLDLMTDIIGTRPDKHVDLLASIESYKRIIFSGIGDVSQVPQHESGTLSL